VVHTGEVQGSIPCAPTEDSIKPATFEATVSQQWLLIGVCTQSTKWRALACKNPCSLILKKKRPQRGGELRPPFRLPYAGTARHKFQIRGSGNCSRFVEPWPALCGQIATGGLRCPDLNRRHQAPFSLVASCVGYVQSASGLFRPVPEARRWPVSTSVAYFENCSGRPPAKK
jgi:hypothetical protein